MTIVRLIVWRLHCRGPWGPEHMSSVIDVFWCWNNLPPSSSSSSSPPASSLHSSPVCHLILPVRIGRPQLTLLYSTQLYNNFQHYTISPAYSTGRQVCLPSRTEILTVPRALSGCFVLLWSCEPHDSDILKSLEKTADLSAAIIMYVQYDNFQTIYSHLE